MIKSKIKVVIFYTLCLFVTLFLIQPTYAKENANTYINNNIYEEVDAYLQESVKSANIPAMSVSIVNKEEVLLSKNYGQCKSSDTPFLLGSVSKSFTAVCIMQLVEQNKIDLKAKLSTYLPKAKDGDKITIGQLLNHTSGLGEHQTLENYKIVQQQGVHHYANVNYSLLGKIIETVSGKTYEEYISTYLFEPLGLSHSAASYEKSIENGLINGYTNYFGFPVQTSHKYPTSQGDWISVPAGYISSSSSDLGKYLQMYLNDGMNILSKESIHTMLYRDTIFVDGDIPFWYGYGWARVKEPLPEVVFRHSGLVETGTSCVFILPEKEMAIAIETNINDYFVTNELMDSLGWGVVLMLLGQTPNKITHSTYLLKHIGIDVILLVTFALAFLPWCIHHKMKQKGKKVQTYFLILFHLLLPIFILLFAPLFFKTPLWVVKAFVPDIFITIIVSSFLLFIGGIIKLILLNIDKKRLIK